ncbi:MAG: hypothetical protein WBE47_18595, partial [Candidatus Acidiferrales bacterium]
MPWLAAPLWPQSLSLPHFFVLTTLIWPQPLRPAHSLGLSALVAAIPLIVVLVLMGGLRKSGLLSSACGLATAGALAIFVWRMPVTL